MGSRGVLGLLEDERRRRRTPGSETEMNRGRGTGVDLHVGQTPPPPLPLPLPLTRTRSLGRWGCIAGRLMMRRKSPATGGCAGRWGMLLCQVTAGRGEGDDLANCERRPARGELPLGLLPAGGGMGLGFFFFLNSMGLGFGLREHRKDMEGLRAVQFTNQERRAVTSQSARFL